MSVTGGRLMLHARYRFSVRGIRAFSSGDAASRVGEGLLFILGLAGAALSSTNAMADPDVGLEEIVVTAQKRPTRLEDTPVAVSAFTPDSIERNRIQGLGDVALRAPSVSFVPINKGEAYVSIRGTRVDTPGAGWDDAVTVFIDDIPMTGVSDNSRISLTCAVLKCCGARRALCSDAM